MEPPAKRLRILRSVEVDEENPDYINAKQKQEQKFKGSLESIFAKYENMHESMSDEIDMRENRVVVDRGHLRRLVRQVNRKETVLLDTLGMVAGQDTEDVPDGVANSEDSEDELAPTQRPESNKRRLDDTTKGQQQPFAETVAQPPPCDSNQRIFQHISTPASATIQAGAQQIPNTPNPAANLLQLVQFPQTPAGQQAQNTFYTTLTQTIDHAVQQAVIPLFSSIFATTPNVQLPLPNVLPTPTTPVTIGDKIAPATDPKWFFPPLSAEPREQHLARSSPISAPVSTSVLKIKPVQEIEKDTSHQNQDHKATRIRSESSREITSVGPASNCSIVREQASSNPQSRRASPRVEIRKRPVGRSRTYHFTEEDDVYISKRKQLHKRTWAEIKNSKQKWEGWPEIVFATRWSKHLKDKKLNLEKVPASILGPREPSIPPTALDKGHFLINQQTSPAETHHLPTPSSLEDEDRQGQFEEFESEPCSNVLSSSAHFDDDERELLSLDGSDTDEEQLPVVNEKETFYTTHADMVLPSVETNAFVDEHTLQPDLLEEPLVADAVPTAIVAPMDTIKIEPLHTSPSSKRRRKTTPIDFQTVPDSEDEEQGDAELGNVNKNSARTSGGAFPCDICHKSFKSAKNLERHQAKPRAMHNMTPKSVSVDLVGDDEIQTPRTPYIKREFSTPPPTSSLLSTSALQTPKLSLQHSGVLSSSSKSTSKLNRKTFLKQIKQSWTKRSTPRPKTLATRRSFHTVPMKRAWAGDTDSEDELAM
ncbi:uncharacterized protein K460DRAFT_421548 [Cucurbitaria berberidis CBS 394.84]|uniref:C2H2-type domain-containing protein n=1 Tax=Cucurbitaria berberidis CBS 394.84 TaxID=1168544 RepID=A0A9P4G7S7_9PLEO|nr:uncharacterized protein K460DRAFT_421548 [Cucurbitaria berberidis CBS 394.84]KAF1840617.1 hypothetical protein K460DRAFT_421548 [Cucurbitaria berberidis CBS 394.84]